jgi:two-component system, cell cycle response regulator DivK
MSQPHAVIIDDNAKNVSVLAQMLADENVTNTQITRPQQIDAFLQNVGQVDVIFLDLEMPGLDGYDVLKKLRSDSRFQGVPIVAYTVHVSEIHAASQEGFDSFIGKPLDPDKFPGQLARILRGVPVWETA